MSLTDKSKFIPLAKHLFKLWDLDPQGIFFSTHSSLLCRVTYQKQIALLKIVEPDDDEANSAEILKYFKGQGAVKLLNAHENALLLEYIQSDNAAPDLEQMVLNGEIEKATHILCDTIEALHAPRESKIAPKTTPFTARFDDMRKYLNEGRVPVARHKQCQDALLLTQNLIDAYKNDNILLHGDVHHFNVLKDEKRGWLAIDPKGFIGPRPYEYSSIFCNPYRHKEIVATSHYMKMLSTIIAERSGLPKDVIAQFAYIHSLQCAAWSLSPPDQDYWFACADAIKETLSF
jgi:streptomycin 6-kinase